MNNMGQILRKIFTLYFLKRHLGHESFSKKGFLEFFPTCKTIETNEIEKLFLLFYQPHWDVGDYLIL